MQDRRFVVQEHTTAEGVHWDLMLEEGDGLTTFRLEAGPAIVVDHAVRAEKIFDHPLRFLTYEGPVQQGAGQVRIVEQGEMRLLKSSENAIVMELAGDILQGVFELTQTEGDWWRFASGSASGGEA